MNTEWITPQVVELTMEEAAGLVDVDLACASTWWIHDTQDHS